MTFRQPEEADACIAAVNRRWFDGRTLEAESWDGWTKYTVKESQEEMDKRLKKWHSFIEEDSTKADDGDSKSKEQSQTDTKTQPDNVPDTSNSSSAVDEDSAVQDVNSSSDGAKTDIKTDMCV